MLNPTHIRIIGGTYVCFLLGFFFGVKAIIGASVNTVVLTILVMQRGWYCGFTLPLGAMTYMAGCVSNTYYAINIGDFDISNGLVKLLLFLMILYWNPCWIGHMWLFGLACCVNLYLIWSMPHLTLYIAAYHACFMCKTLSLYTWLAGICVIIGYANHT